MKEINNVNDNRDIEEIISNNSPQDKEDNIVNGRNYRYYCFLCNKIRKSYVYSQGDKTI